MEAVQELSVIQSAVLVTLKTYLSNLKPGKQLNHKISEKVFSLSECKVLE